MRIKGLITAAYLREQILLRSFRHKEYERFIKVIYEFLGLQFE
jgi:hypothetical protein